MTAERQMTAMSARLRQIVRELLPIRVLHGYRMLRHTVLAPAERELALLPQYLKSDAVAVDVGANVGLYTTVMARHAAQVVAFEPHPDCAAYLRKLRLPRCQIIEAALSDSDGHAMLRVPHEGRGENPALATLAEANDAAARAVSVKTMCLDSALAQHLPATARIGFIKIDVEGHEAAVLRGAAGVITRDRPILLTEVEARHGSDVEAVFAMLASHGYSGFALIDESGLQPIDPKMLRNLQSAERLRRKMQQPRYQGYVNNVIFRPLS
jgi:FkbM family methyltransferase